MEMNTSEYLTVRTDSEDQMVDITSQIRKIVKASGVQNGICVLFVPHTTAAITINENADPDVKSDILLGLRKTFPDRSEYHHREGNSVAHIKSSVIGVDKTIIIKDNDLLLGTWQGIYFCEFDGPRTRKLIVQVFAK